MKSHCFAVFGFVQEGKSSEMIPADKNDKKRHISIRLNDA
jgi:hypothetical protein